MLCTNFLSILTLKAAGWCILCEQKSAMHVVRTIGRVFDVCHQLMQQPSKSPADEVKNSNGDADGVEVELGDGDSVSVQPQDKGYYLHSLSNNNNNSSNKLIYIVP